MYARSAPFSHRIRIVHRVVFGDRQLHVTMLRLGSDQLRCLPDMVPGPLGIRGNRFITFLCRRIPVHAEGAVAVIYIASSSPYTRLPDPARPCSIPARNARRPATMEASASFMALANDMVRFANCSAVQVPTCHWPHTSLPISQYLTLYGSGNRFGHVKRPWVYPRSHCRYSIHARFFRGTRSIVHANQGSTCDSRQKRMNSSVPKYLLVHPPQASLYMTGLSRTGPMPCSQW